MEAWKNELENFVWHLKGIEKRIQCAMKHEENNLNFIAVLDVGITKEGEKLVTKEYRKPTHSQQYINWLSKTCY